MSHPKRRSPTGPVGMVHTGSRNAIRVARWLAAKISLSTLSRLTPAPTAKHSSTASHGYGAARVPTVIRMAPVTARPQKASARVANGPGKLDTISSEIEPNTANAGAWLPSASRWEAIRCEAIRWETTATIGMTIPARNARRAPSDPGSRSRSVSRTR